MMCSCAQVTKVCTCAQWCAMCICAQSWAQVQSWWVHQHIDMHMCTCTQRSAHIHNCWAHVHIFCTMIHTCAQWRQMFTIDVQMCTKACWSAQLMSTCLQWRTHVHDWCAHGHINVRNGCFVPNYNPLLHILCTIYKHMSTWIHTCLQMFICSIYSKSLFIQKHQKSLNFWGNNPTPLHVLLSNTKAYNKASDQKCLPCPNKSSF